MVEVDRVEPVAHVLLVKGRRIGAHLVARLGPEAARIGRQHLVRQDERAVVVLTELELRVGDDDAVLRGVVRRL